MPPALTPRDPSTVVAKQGTEEMATTVQVGAFKTLLIFFTFLRFFLLKKKNKQTNKNNLQQKHFHRSAVLSQSRAKVSAGFTNVGSLQSQHLILYTAPCLYSGLFLSPTIISNLVMK